MYDEHLYQRVVKHFSRKFGTKKKAENTKNSENSG